jgi:hypothetical protein
MLRFLPQICAILALVTIPSLSPASAAELNGWAYGAVTQLLPTDAIAPMPHPAHQRVSFAGAVFVLEETPLSEVAAATGGSVQRRDELAWVCFVVPASPADIRVTFIADHPVHHIAAPVGTVAIEPANPDADREAACVALTSPVELPNLGVPLPGRRAADLSSEYGKAVPDAEGRIVYAREDLVNRKNAQGNTQSRLQLQVVRVLVVNDAVVATTLSQLSLFEEKAGPSLPPMAGSE